MATYQIFTIGHSTKPSEAFVSELTSNGVTAVADVRSAPYSRFNPAFNREALKLELQKHGMAYVFLGKELGGRPSDPACYERGQVSYTKMATTEEFRAGIDRVLRGSEAHRIALMCSEGDPLTCHRALLVARALAARGASIVHIGRNAELETQTALEDRLLRTCGLTDSLLRDRAERIDEAYAIQARRVAYVDRDGAKADAEAV
jgi:uncharacterized protein (DUF488 family)